MSGKKLQITNEKLIEIYEVIKSTGGTEYNSYFLYGLGRNEVLLEPHVRAIQKAVKPEKKWLEYQEKRINLCKKMAIKNEHKVPVVDSSRQFVFEDQEAFNEALEKLKKEYKEAIDNQDKKDESAQALMEEIVEVEYYTIKAKYVPKTIPANLMFAIIPFLDGEPPEPKEESE